MIVEDSPVVSALLEFSIGREPTAGAACRSGRAPSEDWRLAAYGWMPSIVSASLGDGALSIHDTGTGRRGAHARAG
jgi:hypothetical protein